MTTKNIDVKYLSVWEELNSFSIGKHDQCFVIFIFMENNWEVSVNVVFRHQECAAAAQIVCEAIECADGVTFDEGSS